MSRLAQPESPLAPVSQIVRDEIIALLADSQASGPAIDDVRLGMDLVEIAQEGLSEDEIALLRISPAIPA